MVEILDFFNAMEYLEPKCPKCEIVLDYGVNTKYDDKKNAHKCDGCGEFLED